VRPQDAQSGDTAFQATAAGNELVAFQVVATATGGAIANFAASVMEPLAGRQYGAQIPPDNVALYRVGYVETQQATFSATAPGSLGRWPDPLIPAKDAIDGLERNAFLITIPPGENRIAWVDMLVPADLPADDYVGAVQVTGDGLNAQVSVTISVLPFNLPPTSRLASAFLADMDIACQALGRDVDTDGWDVLAQFIRLGLDNRITICSMLRRSAAATTSGRTSSARSSRSSAGAPAGSGSPAQG
jgi:hypothetical protein